MVLGLLFITVGQLNQSLTNLDMIAALLEGDEKDKYVEALAQHQRNPLAKPLKASTSFNFLLSSAIVMWVQIPIWAPVAFIWVVFVRCLPISHR